MMRVIVNGANGRMGSEIVSMIQKESSNLDATLAAAVDVTGGCHGVFSSLAEYTGTVRIQCML